MPGRYRSGVAPYQREPMDSVNDPTVQSTVLMFARQMGKTEIDNNVIGYFIDADPSPIMMVQPTLELANAWSQIRLGPMLRDCPCFYRKVRSPRTRDSGNRILSKLFIGGDIAIVGANSTAGLRSRPRRVLIEDEIDDYPPSVGTEGDPCIVVEQCTQTFWNAVLMKSSTPTIKGFSRIEKEFEETDKRFWFCPCPHCGKHQTLVWRQVLWGKRRVDHWNEHHAEKLPELHAVPDDGSDCIYACEHCHAHLLDAERVKMVRAGEWRPTAPFRGKRGYALNGIATPFKAEKGYKNRLHQMAVNFLKAKRGGHESIKAWTNTFLGETYDPEEGQAIEAQGLMKRCENETYTTTTLPDDIIIIVAGIDIQGDRIEVEIVGVGFDDETWGIEAVKLFGDTEQDEVWQDLADLMARNYTRQDGMILPVTCAAVDMRHKAHKVRQFLRACGHPRVYPVYGVGGDQPLLVTARWNKHYRLRTFAVAAKAAKDVLFARLRVEEPGPRYLHFPKGHGYDEEYFAQLTAEVIKTRYAYGFPERHYEKTRDRNEALDRRVYFLAALDILKPNLTSIARRLKRPIVATTPTPAPAAQRPEPAPGRGMRKRIRVGRW